MRLGFISILSAALLILGGAGGASAQNGYGISSGDVLAIEVLEDPSLNRETLVLPDGSITFPLVGTVQAGGRTITQLRETLTSRLAENFATRPNVFVSVRSLARDRQAAGGPTEGPTIDAFIMGEVTEPGKKAITPGTTILQFLAQAGGLTPFAAPQRIELRRTDPETSRVKTYLFSYTGKAHGPRIRGNTAIAPGDVVIVPQRRLFE